MLPLYLSDEAYDQLRTVADENGLHMSTYVRQLLVKHIKEELPNIK
jgi:predicted DNA-binding protein